MKYNLKNTLIAIALVGGTVLTQAQTPFYSVNGTGGTGSGTAGVTATPSISPSGSTSLTDLGATTQFSFGTGPNGVAGESLLNSATGQPGNGVLAGTLGASSSLSAFTLTMWINMANTASPNNYRILEISTGSPATTGTADGNLLFFGLNLSPGLNANQGGMQFYVNNVNPNTAAVIATNNTFNGGNIAQNTWYFVAVTYDSVANSSLLYSGGQSTATSLQYTYTNGASGALNLSSATSISLLDRFSGGRDWPGAVDDVNLYSGALTPSQLEAIRVAEVAPVPEPATMALLGFGSIAGIMALRRRRS